MEANTVLTVADVAAQLGCTPANVRHHLRAAELAGTPIGRRHSRTWLLYTSDLAALQSWIANLVAKKGFQPGNKAWDWRPKPKNSKDLCRRKSNDSNKLRRKAKISAE